MPKITAIKQQKRKGRFNVYVDGKFGFASPAETLAKAGLAIGQELSKEEIGTLKHQEAVDKLYNQALRFLSYRPRSEREVRDYLLKKIKISKNSPEIAELAITKLKLLELVNDEEFARWWLEQRNQFRPKGIYVLKQELYKKGISQNIIVQLLNGSIVKEAELEGAKKAAQKKLGSLKSLAPGETRQKLTSFLVYRGFSYEIIKLVLDEIKEKG